MATRTTSNAVKGILQKDYDWKDNPSLAAYIETAAALVDRVAVMASNAGVAYGASELELLERWLAAHCYVTMDQTYAEKSTMGASAKFHGKTGMGIEGSRYGQMAINLDYTGSLAQLSSRSSVGAVWLGKTPSQQIPYQDRR